MKEKRLIPVLAVWHYIWHVVKAIFIIHGDWLLIPIAQRLRYRKIKLEANNFHASCGFIVTITKVALHLISKFKLKTDVTPHFNECKDAAVMYSELVNFVYSAGIPLCMLLTAVRSGNFELFRKCVISNLRRFWFLRSITTVFYQFILFGRQASYNKRLCKFIFRTCGFH